MVQLNLLPDVKINYIKTKRTKRMVIGISLVLAAASIGLFVMMFSFVNIAQKGHISRLDKDTDAAISKIQNTQGVNEILTIQNQLTTVDTKHTEKPSAQRILPYLAQFMPQPEYRVTSVSVDFASSTMTISGLSPDLVATNKVIDSFKFAKYKTANSVEGAPFSEIVLSSFSSEKNSDGKTPFSTTMKFDPIIFKNTEEVNILIPNQETTRSYTEKPNLQFSEPVKIEEEPAQ